ncbi:DUF6183 family protein [Nocardia sp. NPDC004415]
MYTEIERIVRVVARDQFDAESQQFVDERVAEGDFGFVVSLAEALATAHGPDQYLVDYAVRALLAAPGGASAALQVVAVMRVRKERVRRIAALVAGSLGHDDAVAAFGAAGLAGPIADELRACLLHELILRGVVVAEHEQIRRWAESAHWAGHPLRALPLEPTMFEHAPALRQYSRRGSSVGKPSSTDGSPALNRQARLPVPSATETTTPAQVAQLESAVSNWQRESNGRTEIRTYRLSHRPDPAVAAALLDSLELACLHAGHPAATALAVTASTPARVWSILFGAAANGGAYNSGDGAAYGRLAAWRSLGALCGATEFDTVDQIIARASDTHWFTFEADTDWFERVAWDLGIVALTPEPGMSILAATDTD